MLLNIFSRPFIPFVIAVLSLLIGHLYQGENESKDDTDIKAISENQKEALKALSDWSKWLVATQSAVVAVIALRLGEDTNTAISQGNTELIANAVFSFIISIVAATILLGAVPDAFVARPIKPRKWRESLNQKLVYNHEIKYDFGDHPTVLWLSIRSLTLVEHMLFLTGLVYLLWSVFTC